MSNFINNIREIYPNSLVAYDERNKEILFFSADEKEFFKTFNKLEDTSNIVVIDTSNQLYI